MLDLKVMRSALMQLEEERKIPREKIIEAIEQALAAAYKKDYGKKGQIVRAEIDEETGKVDFSQIKIVVDESMVWIPTEEDGEIEEGEEEEKEGRVRFNEEHHIFIEDARKIKNDVELEEELVFPLEPQEDYGRIAAQTAKQVIVQKIRDAEKSVILEEYGDKEGEVVSGFVSRVERGVVYVDFNRTTGIILPEEQIPGEIYRQGSRVRAYLYQVEEGPRGVVLKLSRTHPGFIEGLFMLETPEVASGTVEIRSIAREAGSRSKIAVFSHDELIDPVGSCVGQKGVRVTTVMNELNGEKIDIIPWSEDPQEYVVNALSPAKVVSIEILEEENKAVIEVSPDQLSLAIGKGGQNVRLAAKLTGWRIDIKGIPEEEIQNLQEGEDFDNEKLESTEEDMEETETAEEEIVPPAEEEIKETESSEEETVEPSGEEPETEETA